MKDFELDASSQANVMKKSSIFFIIEMKNENIKEIFAVPSR